MGESKPDVSCGILQFFRRTGEPGNQYQLTVGSTTFGGAPETDIRLNIKNPLLEPIHCIFEIDADGSATMITKSTKVPIFVNKVNIPDRVVLKHEDRLEIFDKKIQYLNEALASSAQPAIEQAALKTPRRPPPKQRNSALPVLTPTVSKMSLQKTSARKTTQKTPVQTTSGLKLPISTVAHATTIEPLFASHIPTPSKRIPARTSRTPQQPAANVSENLMSFDTPEQPKHELPKPGRRAVIKKPSFAPQPEVVEEEKDAEKNLTLNENDAVEGLLEISESNKLLEEHPLEVTPTELPEEESLFIDKCVRNFETIEDDLESVIQDLNACLENSEDPNALRGLRLSEDTEISSDFEKATKNPNLSLSLDYLESEMLAQSNLSQNDTFTESSLDDVIEVAPTDVKAAPLSTPMKLRPPSASVKNTPVAVRKSKRESTVMKSLKTNANDDLQKQELSVLENSVADLNDVPQTPPKSPIKTRKSIRQSSAKATPKAAKTVAIESPKAKSTTPKNTHDTDDIESPAITSPIKSSNVSIVNEDEFLEIHTSQDLLEGEQGSAKVVNLIDHQYSKANISDLLENSVNNLNAEPNSINSTFESSLINLQLSSEHNSNSIGGSKPPNTTCDDISSIALDVTNRTTMSSVNELSSLDVVKANESFNTTNEYVDPIDADAINSMDPVLETSKEIVEEAESTSIIANESLPAILDSASEETFESSASELFENSDPLNEALDTIPMETPTIANVTLDSACEETFENLSEISEEPMVTVRKSTSDIVSTNSLKNVTLRRTMPNLKNHFEAESDDDSSIEEIVIDDNSTNVSMDEDKDDDDDEIVSLNDESKDDDLLFENSESPSNSIVEKAEISLTKPSKQIAIHQNIVLKDRHSMVATLSPPVNNIDDEVETSEPRKSRSESPVLEVESGLNESLIEDDDVTVATPVNNIDVDEAELSPPPIQPRKSRRESKLKAEARLNKSSIENSDAVATLPLKIIDNEAETPQSPIQLRKSRRESSKLKAEARLNKSSIEKNDTLVASPTKRLNIIADEAGTSKSPVQTRKSWKSALKAEARLNESLSEDSDVTVATLATPVKIIDDEAGTSKSPTKKSRKESILKAAARSNKSFVENNDVLVATPTAPVNIDDEAGTSQSPTQLRKSRRESSKLKAEARLNKSTIENNDTAVATPAKLLNIIEDEAATSKSPIQSRKSRKELSVLKPEAHLNESSIQNSDAVVETLPTPPKIVDDEAGTSKSPMKKSRRESSIKAAARSNKSAIENNDVLAATPTTPVNIVDDEAGTSQPPIQLRKSRRESSVLKAEARLNRSSITNNDATPKLSVTSNIEESAEIDLADESINVIDSSMDESLNAKDAINESEDVIAESENSAILNDQSNPEKLVESITITDSPLPALDVRKSVRQSARKLITKEIVDEVKTPAKRGSPLKQSKSPVRTPKPRNSKKPIEIPIISVNESQDAAYTTPENNKSSVLISTPLTSVKKTRKNSNAVANDVGEGSTPKSEVKQRRSKVLPYEPLVENITPVTPQIEEPSIKTPLNTPGLFENIRNSVLKSRSKLIAEALQPLPKTFALKRLRDENYSDDEDSDESDEDNVFLTDRQRRSSLSIKSDTSSIEAPTEPTNKRKKPNSPKNDLTDVAGIHKLLRTPRLMRSPKNDLTKVPNLRNLVSPRRAKSPTNDLTDVPNLRNFYSPKKQKSPKNDLTNAPNLRTLMSPKATKSPKNDLTDVRGVKRLLTSPKVQKEPLNDLSDFEGVDNLFEISGVDVLEGDGTSSSDIENKEAFDKLLDAKPPRTYSRSKSTTPKKLLANADSYSPTVIHQTADLPTTSPKVEEWVADQNERIQMEMRRNQPTVKVLQLRTDNRNAISKLTSKKERKLITDESIDNADLISESNNEENVNTLAAPQIEMEEVVGTKRTRTRRRVNEVVEIKSPVRRLRGRGKKNIVQTEDEIVEDAEPVKATRNTRKKGAQTLETDNAEVIIEKPKRGGRKRKVEAVVEVEEEEGAEHVEDEGVELDTVLETAEKVPVSKARNAKKKKTAEPVVVEEEEVKEEAEPEKVEPVRKTRARKPAVPVDYISPVKTPRPRRGKLATTKEEVPKVETPVRATRGQKAKVEKANPAKKNLRSKPSEDSESEIEEIIFPNEFIEVNEIFSIPETSHPVAETIVEEVQKPARRGYKKQAAKKIVAAKETDSETETKPVIDNESETEIKENVTETEPSNLEEVEKPTRAIKKKAAPKKTATRGKASKTEESDEEEVEKPTVGRNRRAATQTTAAKEINENDEDIQEEEEEVIVKPPPRKMGRPKKVVRKRTKKVEPEPIVQELVVEVEDIVPEKKTVRGRAKKNATVEIETTPVVAPNPKFADLFEVIDSPRNQRAKRGINNKYNEEYVKEDVLDSKRVRFNEELAATPKSPVRKTRRAKK